MNHVPSDYKPSVEAEAAPAEPIAVTMENVHELSTFQLRQACKERGKYVGICGQAPSDFPDFAEWLVEEGIESMSLNPDTVVPTTIRVAEVEARLRAEGKL